jgi:hypothetical protein
MRLHYEEMLHRPVHSDRYLDELAHRQEVRQEERMDRDDPLGDRDRARTIPRIVRNFAARPGHRLVRGSP